ncbi:Propenicillopepsin-JT3 [Hyphodiscus hymeniophilus]|uniref:Propenicillopepsin-JT3 n=1 Tax=Hyphodiscus hymeniophilus TaxID=353542 RepID=A0A9P6VJJ8_9HELO|nr:Propenicillopepsin-JT3 [Hyphodiscus hymeniophilus]
MSAAIAKPTIGNLTGSAVANPNPSNFDREYLVPVIIGAVTPQTINMDLDTGSSDLWVFSNSTPGAQATGHVVYQPNTCNASTCAKLLPGETWSIQYSDMSSSSGIVYSDLVTIGGAAVSSQAVEAAQIVSSSFTTDTANSGLLGMAFSSLNTCRPQQQLTWFDNIKASLAAEVWTANLQKGAAGTYNFGYIDSTAYNSNITYTPVSTLRGFWEFTFSGYQLGSSSFVTTDMAAIADTGTTLLLLPSAVVESYWAQVPSAHLEPSLGAYIYPCSATPPNFTFGIGSYRGVVPGSYLAYGPVSSQWCYGGIQSQGSSPFSVFGDVLLKAQFVVFDVGNLRIGYAAKKT